MILSFNRLYIVVLLRNLLNTTYSSGYKTRKRRSPGCAIGFITNGTSLINNSLKSVHCHRSNEYSPQLNSAFWARSRYSRREVFDTCAREHDAGALCLLLWKTRGAIIGVGTARPLGMRGTSGDWMRFFMGFRTPTERTLCR